MYTLYAAYTDDEPDEVVVEELVDWLQRRMPAQVEAFKRRLCEEPDFRARIILLMRGKASLLQIDPPDLFSPETHLTRLVLRRRST